MSADLSDRAAWREAAEEEARQEEWLIYGGLIIGVITVIACSFVLIFDYEHQREKAEHQRENTVVAFGLDETHRLVASEGSDGEEVYILPGSKKGYFMLHWLAKDGKIEKMEISYMRIDLDIGDHEHPGVTFEIIKGAIKGTPYKRVGDVLNDCLKRVKVELTEEQMKNEKHIPRLKRP